MIAGSAELVFNSAARMSGTKNRRVKDQLCATCFRDGQKRVRWDPGERPPGEQLRIRAQGGKNMRIIPDCPFLWAGISWVVITLESASGEASLAVSTNQVVKDFEVQVYSSTGH